jgi:hypothetical protein
MKRLVFVALSLLLAGCSPNWHPPDPDALMAAALGFQANDNGMSAHPAVAAPTFQTTHCTQNPFNGSISCTTF